MAIFGQPPLIKGERLADYKSLSARVFGAVLPTDFIEQMLVQDVVDLVWEVGRLRRFRVALMKSSEYKAIRHVLTPRLDRKISNVDANQLADLWAKGDQRAITFVKKLINSLGLTMDAVWAEALVINIDGIERLDRMIMAVEARRDAALREIDRHRATLGEKLRRATQVIEDADYKEVEGEKEGEVTPLLEAEVVEQGAQNEKSA